MIVPMVNPDGVYEGNYRMDPSNRNLNRLYLNPTFENQYMITIIQTRNICYKITSRLFK